MSNCKVDPVNIKLDIFPEVYNSGLSVNELIEALQEATRLNAEDRLLVLTGNCLKTVTIATLQAAIGGGGSEGGGITDTNVYAVISE